jgi:hypothetical protein
MTTSHVHHAATAATAAPKTMSHRRIGVVIRPQYAVGECKKGHPTVT